MITGLLGYNSRNDRYGLLVMDLWEIEGFHCGDTLEVWDSESDQWIPTRIEMRWKNEWYTQLIKPTAAERDRQNADKTNRFVMRTKQ